MKYRLKNLVITNAKNSRGDYKWMRVELFNESDPFANATSSQAPTMPIFDSRVIDMYMPYAEADPTRPGSFKVNEVSLQQAIDKGDVPDILHWANIFAVTMPLPRPYGRIYRTDVKDTATGAITHKKGDWVIPEGQSTPTIITQLTINVHMVIDNETGERTYPAGGAPDKILQRLLESSYRPVPTESTVVEAPTAPANDAAANVSAEELAKLASA